MTITRRAFIKQIALQSAALALVPVMPLGLLPQPSKRLPSITVGGETITLIPGDINFNNGDSYIKFDNGDRIMPGAFTKTLKEINKDKRLNNG